MGIIATGRSPVAAAPEGAPTRSSPRRRPAARLSEGSPAGSPLRRRTRGPGPIFSAGPPSATIRRNRGSPIRLQVLSRRGGAGGSSDALFAAPSSRCEAGRRLPGRIAITEADAGVGSAFFPRGLLRRRSDGTEDRSFGFEFRRRGRGEIEGATQRPQVSPRVSRGSSTGAERAMRQPLLSPARGGSSTRSPLHRRPVARPSRNSPSRSPARRRTGTPDPIVYAELLSATIPMKSKITLLLSNSAVEEKEQFRGHAASHPGIIANGKASAFRLSLRHSRDR